MATVIQIKRSTIRNPRPKPTPSQEAPCPVCEITIENDESVSTCSRCEARLHWECYWGRILPLAEWQDFLRRYWADGYVPDTVCPTCRLAFELGGG